MRRPAFMNGDKRDGEAGYMLIAVLVLVAMVLIALAVAAPQVAVDLQRDKEGELFHRGMQYAGAIRRYYRRFGAYPNSLDQLDKTNNIRFLRRRYKDPITGKDEWKLIRFGQATTTGTGMFGQPAPTAGGGTGTGTGTGTGGGTSALGGNSGSSFGDSGSSFGNSGSSFGNSGSGGSSFGASGSSGASGTGSSTDPNSGGSGTSGGTPIGGGSGPTFGGGGIIGVSSTSPKQSIREYKKQTHYNQWEFLYDPNQDNRTPGSTGTGVATTPGGTQSNSPLGNQPSGNNGFGPQPTSPNMPTAPQTQ